MELGLSNEFKASVQQFLKSESTAKKRADLEKQINDKKNEIIRMETDLSILKDESSAVSLGYRKEILWCLKVDVDHRNYFLKSKEGLVKCTEYKHKIRLTPKQNNAFGATLSLMFKQGLLGRIDEQGVYFYGLPLFFERDTDGFLTVLKGEHVRKLPYLRKISV